MIDNLIQVYNLFWHLSKQIKKTNTFTHELEQAISHLGVTYRGSLPPCMSETTSYHVVKKGCMTDTRVFPLKTKLHAGRALSPGSTQPSLCPAQDGAQALRAPFSPSPQLSASVTCTRHGFRDPAHSLASPKQFLKTPGTQVCSQDLTATGQVRTVFSETR